MKKIKQPAEINFCAPTIQEVITMVPLMDKLAKDFQELSKLVETENRQHLAEYHKLGNQLLILEGLGFCPSVPGMIQYNPNHFNIKEYEQSERRSFP